MESKKRFEDNYPLVLHMYKRSFTEFSAYAEDLIQEGSLALWRACTNYKENQETQFSTYACVCIKRAMLNYVNRFIKKSSHTVSFDSVVAEDGEGRELYLSDIIGSEDDPTDMCFIEDCILKLPQLKQSIIHKLIDGYTQVEIANLLHVSQSYVCRCLNQFRIILTEELNNEQKS